jgi:hypothetical protein
MPISRNSSLGLQFRNFKTITTPKHPPFIPEIPKNFGKTFTGPRIPAGTNDESGEGLKFF